MMIYFKSTGNYEIQLLEKKINHYLIYAYSSFIINIIFNN